MIDTAKAFEEFSKHYQELQMTNSSEWLKLTERMFSKTYGSWVNNFANFQIDVIKQIFIDSKTNQYVLNWYRQGGKSSTMGIAAIVYVLLNYPRRVNIICAAPIQRQSKHVFEGAEEALSSMVKDELDIFWIGGKLQFSFLKRRTDNVMRFINGSKIEALPGVDVRGHKCDLLLLDECSRIEEKLWRDLDNAMKVIRGGGRSTMIAGSTPSGTSNVFYRLWMRPEVNRGNQGYPWLITYLDSTFADKTKIEADKDNMPARVFNEDFLCRFEGSGRQAIPEALLNKQTKDYDLMYSIDDILLSPSKIAPVEVVREQPNKQSIRIMKDERGALQEDLRTEWQIIEGDRNE